MLWGRKCLQNWAGPSNENSNGEIRKLCWSNKSLAKEVNEAWFNQNWRHLSVVIFKGEKQPFQPLTDA